MLTKLFTHLRRQWMGALALFLVFTGGSAYALAGHNSVSSDDIKNGQVKDADAAKIKFHDAGLSTHGGCSGVTDEWINVQGADNPAGYYRDLQGRVFITGSVARCGNPPDSTNIFTLPPGFRPLRSQVQPAMRNGLDPWVVGLSPFTGGVMEPLSADGDTMQLDGVNFQCGPSGQHGCP
jgi:hypothetical protein